MLACIRAWWQEYIPMRRWWQECTTVCVVILAVAMIGLSSGIMLRALTGHPPATSDDGTGQIGPAPYPSPVQPATPAPTGPDTQPVQSTRPEQPRRTADNDPPQTSSTSRRPQPTTTRKPATTSAAKPTPDPTPATSLPAASSPAAATPAVPQPTYLPPDSPTS